MARGLRAFIMEYFDKHPGVVVYNSEVQEAWPGTPISDGQIQTAIAALKRNKGWDITTEVAGRAWRYKPERASNNGKRIFEELATLKNGDILIQDEEAAVYRAIPMS